MSSNITGSANESESLRQKLETSREIIENLEKVLLVSSKRVNTCLSCINSIGDYFEYSHESDKDKAFVMSKIKAFTKQLSGGL